MNEVKSFENWRILKLYKTFSIRYPKVIEILIPISLFCLYMCLYLFGLYDETFCDEQDVFSGGISLSRGYLLYTEYTSQHMPFTYYLSSLFCLLGASGTIRLRIYFYIFYSFIWVLLYMYFQKFFNKKILIITPFLYISLTHTYVYGTLVLSEHIAALGFVALMLVFIKFYFHEHLNIIDYIIISLSIVFTFGSIFIASLGVLVIIIGFILKEIFIYKKNKLHNFIFLFIKKYWLLLLICLSPWLIYFLYLLLTNTLNDALYWAVNFNLDVYNKYLDNQPNAVHPFLVTAEEISKITINICDFVLHLDFTGWTKWSLLIALVLLLLICFFISIFIKKQYLLFIVTLLMIFATSPRGIFDGHGSQCVAIISLFVAFFIDIVFEKNKFINNNIKWKVSILLIVILLFSIPTLYSSLYVKRIPIYDKTNMRVKEELNLIMNENEGFWGAISGSNLFSTGSNKPKLYDVSTCPWFWEVTGISYLENTKSKLPRVTLYGPCEIAGYKSIDFSPELDSWMNQNYKKVDDIIWVKNEYYNEAYNILHKNNFI